mmetsp:Transcript_19489/g.25249  ORF Transcript_19489/g.25249 Transcript_19489/m.25249 type:complete len:135 (+) Transcript_19489:19-423(+)
MRVLLLLFISPLMHAFIAPRSFQKIHKTLRVMPLTEENVENALVDARTELSQLFGYDPENVQVGITGKVDFVELEGPTVILRLSGRFWHERSLVLARVGNFLQNYIPEICDVVIEDPSQLDDSDKPALSEPSNF